ncbi:MULTISPECIES: hypothetical protein [Kosakonia]|uniref:hypothetical protein n=1 Tax=Kosakonia TaxID=1330547 RepID=UPI000AF35377|nr:MULTISPECIES: hypothetical protein [Kosakonia]RCX06236.1 hypothetical protein DFO56_101375 [Kosakonia sp. AG348]
MLQFCNGNFLQTDKLYKTQHRTPLYTNLEIPREGIDFCIGKILPSSMYLSPMVIICEVEERQPSENPDGSKAVLISTTGQDLMDDLAHVISFYFRGLCTTSQSFTKQLLSGEKIAGHTTSDYLCSFFDERITVTQEQASEFQSFFSKLVNSPRTHYEKSIQAIRRYVTAAIRISDDLDAAYTLFVASIESLAQDTLETEITWNDVPPQKRKGLDRILENLDNPIANSIRAEIIAHEHLALSRKFIKAVMSSLNKNFYKTENKKFRLVGENELRIATKNAYNLRSKYVHILKPLPTEISEPYNLDYCVEVDDKPHLTFNGLSAVTREVILKFVNDMPVCKKENIDILKIIPGVRFARMSELYWMNDVRALVKGNYISILNAVLSRIEHGIVTEKHEIPNMQPIVNEIGNRLKTENNKDDIRILMSILILLSGIYKFTLDDTYEKTIQKHSYIYESKGIEMLLINTMFGKKLESINEYYTSFKEYANFKYQKNKLKLSEFFESLICANLVNHFSDNPNNPVIQELLDYIDFNTPNSPIKTEHYYKDKGAKFDIYGYLKLKKHSNSN